MKRAFGLGLALVLGCSAHPRVSSCADDLTGLWSSPAGERWMFLDHGPTLEAYPIFADSAGSGDVLGAPRVIDLHRLASGLDGQIKRRFARRAETCEARAAIHVTACSEDLELTLADPPSPLDVGPCRWPEPASPRTERWHRE